MPCRGLPILHKLQSSLPPASQHRRRVHAPRPSRSFGQQPAWTYPASRRPDRQLLLQFSRLQPTCICRPRNPPRARASDRAADEMPLLVTCTPRRFCLSACVLAVRPAQSPPDEAPKNAVRSGWMYVRVHVGMATMSGQVRSCPVLDVLRCMCVRLCSAPPVLSSTPRRFSIAAGATTAV